MKWVGLTGGIGSGKTTVSELIKGLGFAVIDADELAKQVVQKNSRGLKEIIETFGDEYLTASGELDRQKLGRLVFSNKDSRQKLEAITHPKIQELKKIKKQQLENQGVGVAFYDVPLLFEKGLQKDFDLIVVVYSDVEQQLNRLKKRNTWSKQEIQDRMNSQIPLVEKKAKADFVIMNTGSLDDLKARVKECINKIQSL